MKQLPELTLAELRAFHDDLRSLCLAGIPFRLGPAATSSSEILAFLDELDKRMMAMQAQQPSDNPELIGKVIQSDTAIPTAYRQALWAWLRSDRDPASLEPLVAQSEALEGERAHRRATAITPLVWICVGLFALAILCLVLFPQVVRFAASIEHSSWVIQLIEGLQSTLVVWLVGLPLLGCGLWWLRNAARASRRAEKPTYFQLASIRAALAKRAAVLSEHQVPLGEIDDQQQLPSSAQGQAPLLAWAMQAAENSPQAEASTSFWFANRLYCSLVTLQAAALRSLAPSVLALVIGSLMALVIGLAVFLPIIDLLLRVASGGKR